MDFKLNTAYKRGGGEAPPFSYWISAYFCFADKFLNVLALFLLSIARTNSTIFFHKKYLFLNTVLWRFLRRWLQIVENA